MPRVSPADLLPLLECEGQAMQEALRGVLGTLGRDSSHALALVEPLLALRARAQSQTPPASREELALAILALLSLEVGASASEEPRS